LKDQFETGGKDNGKGRKEMGKERDGRDGKKHPYPDPLNPPPPK